MAELRRSRRIAVAECVAALACALALALPSAASPAEARGAAEPAAIPPDADVQIKRTSQSRILETGELRARVFAEKPGGVTVTAGVGPPFDPDAPFTKPTPVIEPKKLRFEKRGSVKLGLKLTDDGRGLIANCSPKLLTMTVRIKPRKGGAKTAGPNRSSRSLDLVIDNPACQSPPPTLAGGPRR
jgi:hypothetical protein